MFICICEGITKDDLIESIKSGNKTLDKLMEVTGAGSGCSTCQTDIEKILIETNQCSWKPPIFPLTILKSC